MTVSIQLYESQVVNFLKSCTISFSYMATIINQNLSLQGYIINENDPTTWKYYLNISGQYHQSDTMMVIQSIDTKQQINFTVDNLNANPKTKSLYTIGSDYYNNLCEIYPSQVDLIKSILYPTDINAAINAKDFTLLTWGEGYLESDEEEAIINELNKFIEYAVSRWYFSFLNYECYYPWTFWSMLWQQLPGAIFAARIKYLKTSYVHSFHIWAYLNSLGIGDYSDILTRRQSLFLYRNMRYLNQNRGTQSNLIILVNNLLDNVNVGLVGKTIYMNTLTNVNNCIWTPEFVSTIIPTVNSQSLTIIPPESMTQMNADLLNAGLEVNNTTAYIQEQQTFISETTCNILPTKIVEIQKLSVDEKYNPVLINFTLDTLIYMIVNNLYAPIVNFTDPTTEIEVSISATDALILYYYAIYSEQGITPTYIPDTYTPSCAYQPNIQASEFPETFPYDGQTYITSSFLNVEGMISGLGYPENVIYDPDEFSSYVSDQFLNLLSQIKYSRSQTNYIANKIFYRFMNEYVLQTTPYTFTLNSTNTNYSSWANSLKLNTLLYKLTTSPTPRTNYGLLSTAIMSALVPWNTSVFSLYGYTAQSVDDTYDRLKTLFEQLCSYNITFLDTDRQNRIWMLTNPLLSYINSDITSTTIKFNPISMEPSIVETSSTTINSPIVDTYVGVKVTSTVVNPGSSLMDYAVSSINSTSTIVDISDKVEIHISQKTVIPIVGAGLLSMVITTNS